MFTVLVSLVGIAPLVPVASLVIVTLVVVAECITGTICAAPCAIAKAPLQELACVRNHACTCAWHNACIIPAACHL